MEKIHENGWIYLYHEETEDEKEFTYDEYIEWLQNIFKVYKKIYNSVPKNIEQQPLKNKNNRGHN